VKAVKFRASPALGGLLSHSQRHCLRFYENSRQEGGFGWGSRFLLERRSYGHSRPNFGFKRFLSSSKWILALSFAQKGDSSEVSHSKEIDHGCFARPEARRVSSDALFSLFSGRTGEREGSSFSPPPGGKTARNRLSKTEEETGLKEMV